MTEGMGRRDASRNGLKWRYAQPGGDIRRQSIESWQQGLDDGKGGM